MPYSRSNRRYRRRARKTRVMGGIRKAYGRRRPMTTGKVKRIIGAELKFRDLGVGPVVIPTVTGNVTHITNIAQGDTALERQGNWIKPSTLMGTLTMTGNTNQVQPTSQFRVGVICWKENQDVDAITLAKFMQDVVSPHQQYNIQSKGSFKVLWSRVGILSNDFNNSQHQKILRFYVKPPMKVLYDDADFRKYHLFIFGYSDRDVADQPPSYSFDLRLRFTDS